MVYGAVADALVVHGADDALEGLDVVGGGAVQLHVGDMAGVGQAVIGGLQVDLLIGRDGEVDRDVEAVGVVFAVGDAGDDAVLLAVDAHEAAGEALGGGGQEGEVQLIFLGLAVHEVAHEADDVDAQALRLLGLAVMVPGEGDQGLGQADEAHGQGAVLEDLAHGVVQGELVGVDPHALTHQEAEVADLLGALDLEAVQQLLAAQLHLALQLLEEPLDVVVGLDGDAGEVDGGEAQVAAAGDDLAVRIVDVADDAGAAAHVGDFGLGMAGLVVLQVEGGVQEGEVREQALGGGLHGQAEQVVVGIAGVGGNAGLDLEDLDGVDGGLAVAQTRLGGQQQVAHDHAALGAGIGAVVQGGEGHLGAGAAVHGVEVVDQGLHGLVGGAVGFGPGVLGGEGADLLVEGGLQVEEGLLDLIVGGIALQGRGLSLLLPDGLDGLVDLLVLLGEVGGQQLQRLGEVAGVELAVGLAHALGHGVVEGGDALAAVLVVLVGLDGDAGQGGVAGDVVGLAQVAVAGGEAAVEEL